MRSISKHSIWNLHKVTAKPRISIPLKGFANLTDSAYVNSQPTHYSILNAKSAASDYSTLRTFDFIDCMLHWHTALLVLLKPTFKEMTLFIELSILD